MDLKNIKRKKHKDERMKITIRLNDNSLKEKFDKLAEKERTFSNELFNLALEEFINKYYK